MVGAGSTVIVLLALRTMNTVNDYCTYDHGKGSIQAGVNSASTVF